MQCNARLSNQERAAANSSSQQSVYGKRVLNIPRTGGILASQASLGEKWSVQLRNKNVKCNLKMQVKSSSFLRRAAAACHLVCTRGLRQD